MSWRKDRGRAERGYHHGNLKEALLQAALGLIAEKGAAGFTFADAARMAGVSPAAPYRHFRDRDELLSSIAQRGFEQFEAALTQAWDDGRPDTVTAFERVGKAYLAFARNEPAFYSAMFESGLPADANPALMAASERQIGTAEAFKRRERMWPAIIPCLGQCGFELAEPAQGHTGEQLVAIAKMPVGRGRTDAGGACRLGKGEAARPLFGDQVKRGPHQGFFEIAVMIAARRCLPAHVNGLYIRRNKPSM